MNLFHSRLLSSLRNFHPSRVTIEKNLGVPAVGSGQVEDDWQPVQDLKDLPCAEGPGGEGDAALSRERRGEPLTVLTQSRVITLAGHYPEITEEMRAVIGTAAYDILAIDHGILQATTRLRVEKVTA